MKKYFLTAIISLFIISPAEAQIDKNKSRGFDFFKKFYADSLKNILQFSTPGQLTPFDSMISNPPLSYKEEKFNMPMVVPDKKIKYNMPSYSSDPSIKYNMPIYIQKNF